MNGLGFDDAEVGIPITELIQPVKRMAIRVDWTESERGWGTRPDGTSLHKDEATAQAFIDAHWMAHQKKHGDKTPAEYSYPHEMVKTLVSERQYVKLQEEGSYWASLDKWPASIIALEEVF